MIIKSVHVKNFRCILDGTLACEPLTAIVGPNGAGKSSFLRALEIFHAENSRITPEDFYNGNTENAIEITVTFSQLEQDAKDKFSAYLEGEELTVTRVISLSVGRISATYHGARLQNSDFAPIRQASPAATLRLKYRELRQQSEYGDLPADTSQAADLEALRQWEEQHSDLCTRQQDEGQFFGFTGVGQGYLGRYTRFIHIPAVRDAAEDVSEGRGRVITEIMDLVVRATLANREDLTTLRRNAQEQYEAIMAAGNVPDLVNLSTRLTSTLKTYVPDASIEIQWLTEGGIEISMPKADVKLAEDGYASAVERTGHGLQRAFILTMLQHLAAAQADAAARTNQQREDGAETAEVQTTELLNSSATMPNLILCIEEPELYQHPNRQRHLAKILLQLANGALPGVAPTTQILYTTHSPLFVGIDRFDQVRVLRKMPNGSDSPKITKVVEVHGDTVAEAIWEACDRCDRSGASVPKFTWESLKPRLQTIMTPWMAEGYFADVVVLVEGEDDRAALIGAALERGYDLESLGVTVVPCGGKTSLDRPCAVFQHFNIPVYLMWDGDRYGKEPNPRLNHILLRLAGHTVVDWPSGVYDGFTCFENKLEDTVRDEVGQSVFDSILLEVQDEFGYYSKEDAVKNPYIFRELLSRSRDQGARCSTLEAAVNAILKLKPVPIPEGM